MKQSQNWGQNHTNGKSLRLAHWRHEPKRLWGPACVLWYCDFTSYSQGDWCSERPSKLPRDRPPPQICWRAPWSTCCLCMNCTGLLLKAAPSQDSITKTSNDNSSRKCLSFNPQVTWFSAAQNYQIMKDSICLKVYQVIAVLSLSYYFHGCFKKRALEDLWIWVRILFYAHLYIFPT